MPLYELILFASTVYLAVLGALISLLTSGDLQQWIVEPQRATVLQLTLRYFRFFTQLIAVKLIFESILFGIDHFGKGLSASIILELFFGGVILGVSLFLVVPFLLREFERFIRKLGS